MTVPPEDPDADAGTAEADVSAEVESPRRRRRFLIWGVLGLFVVWLAVAAVLGVRTRSSLLDGSDHMETARAGLSVKALVRGEQIEELQAAADDFQTAEDASNSWLLAPLKVVPWVGRQLSSVQSITVAASDLAELGVDASKRMSASIGDGAIAPEQRARVAGDVAATAEQVDAELDDVDLGPSADLVAPLRTARAKLERATTKLDQTLDDVAVGGTGFVQFLDGPSHYLLLAAHNGEMRAGTGMFLSAGVLTVTDGRFDVGDMTSTTDLRLPPGAVTLPADLDALWGWAGPGQEWRNLSMSPDFPATAALAADMWKAKTGETVDGVMVMDIVALRRLVAVVGSVQLADRTLTKDTVTDFVMVDQYRDIKVGENIDELTALRRDRLSELAEAVVGQLDENRWDITTLIDEMQSAIRARHVLLWSSDADQEAAWRASGAAGAISKSSLMLSLISQGGTKIDRYIQVTPTMERAPGDVEGIDHVKIEAGLHNDTPEGLPPYVAGPTRRLNPNVGVPEGVYAGIAAFTVPRDATNVRLAGAPPLVAGPDGPTQVIGRRVELARDASETIVLEFDIPRDSAIELLPSAKIPVTHWNVNGSDVPEAAATVMPSR